VPAEPVQRRSDITINHEGCGAFKSVFGLRAPASRSYLVIAAAIVIVGALIAGSVLVVLGGASKTTTETSGVTLTDTSTLTQTATSTLMQTATSTLTQTSVSTATLTSYSTLTYTSLELHVRLNATTVAEGGAIAAQVSVFNPLGENITVVPSQLADVPIVTWNGYDFICNDNPAWSLVGYALFQGYYTSANLSSAGAPLTLAPPVEPPCVTFSSPDQVVFLPNGSSAVALYSTSSGAPTLTDIAMNASTKYDTTTPVGSTYVGVGTSLLGYWNMTGGPKVLQLQNATGSSPYLDRFSPGQYTLVAEDAWGQTVFASFKVTPPASGLELQLSLSTSPSSSGVAVNVAVNEYDPLASAVDAAAADGWAVPLGVLNGAPCWTDDWPVGFAIASGYYTASNVTAAKLLDLVDPSVTYSCPPYLGVFSSASSYLFQPGSDTATGNGCWANYTCVTEAVSAGVGPSFWPAVTGYWSQEGTFTSFPRGTYTVLAEDEWGNVQIAHFSV
jgi:hypothetical protein